MIELYIENKLIELENELEVELTYETIDPNKLASIKNSFSKTVSIPGTPKNNITFGHIFRNDKYILINIPGSPIESFYDPHKKITWMINRNGSLVQRGYCTLDSIDVNNDGKVTYKLTLYGGLGEFFYSLGYNEDGTPKTLKDVWYHWRPKTTQYEYGNPMNQAEEMIDTLMVCSPYIIVNAYHNLNPIYTYEGTTDIDKDVVFVPCYTGLYNDFDSKHMLVSTFNQNYAAAPLSTQTRQKLKDIFKDSITEDDVTYTTLDRRFTYGGYSYGLATFSRDLDPTETGDLRINELPVAIRLSKLLWAITRPENCGGYEVEWSQSILDSLCFLYGWVLLGKLDTPKETIEQITFGPSQYDTGYITISYNEEDQGAASSADLSYNTLYSNALEAGRYIFNIIVKPKFSFETRYQSQAIDFYEDPWMTAALWMTVSGTNVNIWTRYNTYVIIHTFMSDSMRIATIADVFFYSTDPNEYFGRDSYHTTEDYVETLKTSLENFIGNGIDKITIHNCKPEISSDTHDPSDGTFGRLSISAECANETISFGFNHIGTNITIEQQYLLSFIQWGKQSTPIAGVWGFDDPYNSECPRNLTFFGSPYSQYRTQWYFRPHNEDYIFSIDYINGGLFLSESTGFNILNLDKGTLFASTESPFKYLTDYCKMMNYKFICDNINKKITILDSNEFYEDKMIDLNDKVDYSRLMTIKPVIAKNKLIDVGLKPLDTYPIELVERNLDYKFGIKKFDTNIEYSLPNTTMLDNLVYKSSLDWQLNSIFYHIYPQFPKAYNTPTLSWTLFNYDSGELNKKEFVLLSNDANSNTLTEKYDQIPKLALFDNSQKYVKGTSLVFFNGFVKNYEYVQYTGESLITAINPTQIKPNTYVNYQTPDTERPTQLQVSLHIYENIDPTKTYYVTADTFLQQDYYVVNYYTATGNPNWPYAWIGSELPYNGMTNTRVQLNIPSDTALIKCNFRNADNNAKLEAEEGDIQYAISPLMVFSVDTLEQYYFNGGKRCYIYDFKYNDNFTSWGCYSSDQKGTATSWVLPYFTRDLYNKYIYRNNNQQYQWVSYPYKLASWNMYNQNNLDNIYSLAETVFIKNPQYFYQVTPNSTAFLNNQYNSYTLNIPQDLEGVTIRPWSKWVRQLNDIYDRNSREVTLYVDLTQFSDPNKILRQTYLFEGSKWIITKIHNFKISNYMKDKFTKVTMKKIVDIDAWIA